MADGSQSEIGTGNGPVRRKVGRLAAAFLIGLGLASAVLAALFWMRVAVVEAVLVNRLGALGLTDVDLAVEGVGLRRTRVGAITVGRDGELRIERVTATYDPRDLLRGGLPRLDIDGLRLNVGLGENGLSLGSLDALLKAGDGEAGATRIPTIRLRDVRIVATTPTGPVTIVVDGTVAGTDNGAAEADFVIEIDSAYGAASGTLETTVDDQGAVVGEYVIVRGDLRFPGAEIDGLAGGASFAITSGGELESAAARLTIPRATLGETGLGATEVRFAYNRGRVEIDASLSDADGGFTATIHATVDDARTMSRIELSAEGELAARSGLWRLADLPAPDSGRARVTIAAGGPIPPLASLAGDPAAGLDRLTGGGLAGNLTLGVEGVTYPGIVTGLAAALDMDIAIDANGIALTLPDGGLVEVREVAGDLLRQAGVPRDFIGGLDQPLSLALEGIAGAPFRIAIKPGEDAAAVGISGAAVLRVAGGGAIKVEAGGTFNLGTRADLPLFDLPLFALRATDLSVAGHRLAMARAAGRLSGTAPDALDGAVDLSLDLPRLTVEDIGLADVRADIPLAFRLNDHRLTFWIGDSGTLEAGSLAIANRLQIDDPLRLTVEGQVRPVVDMAFDASGNVSFSHYVKLRTDKLTGWVPREDGTPIEFAMEPIGLRLNGDQPSSGGYRAKIELTGEGFILPGFEIAAGEFGASLVLGPPGNGRVGRFGISNARHLGDPAMLAPLQITGTVDRHNGVFVFAVDGADRDGVRRIAVRGNHSLANGSGDASVDIAPAAFSPGGLQPKDLFPALADLKSVSGSAAVRARLRWQAGVIDGSGEVDVEDLSFTQSDLTVEGLTAAIRFDSLMPPTTPPGQKIAARRIDPAVPLTDVTLRFQLDAGGAAALGRLRVEHAEAGFAGGRLSLDDAVIEPGAERHDATVVMSGLDLEQMFRIIDVDGLSGGGTLSGSIPLAFADETVIVEGGLLTADGEGVIRFRSEQAASALAGGGEQVGLMLRALEDFRYENLSISLDKGPVGDARIGLRMLGQNPAVLDGQPFQFNINLSGNLDKVLAAVLEGYRASNSLLGRAFSNQ